MAYNYPNTLVLLQTQTASSSADLHFTSLITTGFSKYYVSIRDLIPATNNVILNLTVSTDNGSTYLSTNYAYSHWDQTSAAGGSGINSASDTTIQLSGGLSSTTSRGLCADFQMVNIDVGT